MALPADYQTVPIHGKWILLDGSPASGTVKFTPSAARLSDAASATVIAGSSITVSLDTNGEIGADGSFHLPATDDPDVTGTPFTYAVSVQLNSSSYSFNLSVPVATVGTIELATTAPAAPGAVTSQVAIPASTLTAKGDLIAARGALSPSRLAVGSDGQSLVADSSQPLGVKWSTIVVSEAGLIASDFGAVGDGVSDSTAGLAAWITRLNTASGGGLAILPAGQYLTSAPLPTITTPGATLFGAGHAQTAFQAGSCISAKAGYSGGAILTLAGEGDGVEKIMVDGQGTASGLIVVSAANCRLRDFGLHGVAAGVGGVPNVCVDIQAGAVSCWVTGSWRINGINYPNTAIQANDTDAIIEGGKPTNNTYNIVLLSGASGAKIQGNHMTPGASGANCVWVNGNPSHVAIDNNRFDNYVQSGVQITPPASTPNSIEIMGNEFHSAVITDNTYAAIGVDTTLSGCRALKVIGNAVYGSSTHRPKYFLSAQTQAGAAATNTGRLASLGTICNSNVAWAATSFYGLGTPTVSRGNMTATDGQTYTAVADV